MYRWRIKRFYENNESPFVRSYKCTLSIGNPSYVASFSDDGFPAVLDVKVAKSHAISHPSGYGNWIMRELEND